MGVPSGVVNVPLLSIGGDRLRPLSRWRERDRVRVGSLRRLGPSPCPLPGVPGRGDKFLSPDELKAGRSQWSMGDLCRADTARIGARMATGAIFTGPSRAAQAEVVKIRRRSLASNCQFGGFCVAKQTVHEGRPRSGYL